MDRFRELAVLFAPFSQQVQPKVRLLKDHQHKVVKNKYPALQDALNKSTPQHSVQPSTMPVYLLNKDEPSFPHASLAEESGLIAVGGDLSESRLLMAYCNGIFPWFQEGADFFWYSPDPRFVLYPNELRVHKSMRSIFNKGKFKVTLDTCFEAVMRACASTLRHPYDGTWITEAFVTGYNNLHQHGLAHSVEVWEGDDLVGGLYGVSVGKVFFGESMFSRVPNASKAGFITLVRALEKSGFWLIDCQVETEHLGSLGARGIPRSTFLEQLERNAYQKTLGGKWRFSEDGSVVCEVVGSL